MTVMMSLQAVQSMITSSCDFPGMDMRDPDAWRELLNYKSSDTGFGHLVESMLTHGWDASQPIPIINGCIREAHHRLTAAIMLCMDEIPVVTSWSDWDASRTAYWSNVGVSSVPDLCAHYDEDAPYSIPYDDEAPYFDLFECE